MDDEFAKDVSEFDTLKDLKDQSEEERSPRSVRRTLTSVTSRTNLMEQVADEHHRRDPRCDGGEPEADQYLDNFKAQISRQFPYEEYKKMTGMDDAKLLEEAKEPALRQVKLDLATAAIIKAENIEASR